MNDIPRIVLDVLVGRVINKKSVIYSRPVVKQTIPMSKKSAQMLQSVLTGGISRVLVDALITPTLAKLLVITA